MSHLLRYTEWETQGRWYCNDVSDICGLGSYWGTPAVMLGISRIEYIKLLFDKFHPDKMSYSKEHDVLLFSWKSQAAMRKFKNWLNAEARKRNFLI